MLTETERTYVLRAKTLGLTREKLDDLLNNQNLQYNDLIEQYGVSKKLIAFIVKYHNVSVVRKRSIKIDEPKFIDCFNRGLSDREIALEMCISVSNVEKHRQRLRLLRDQVQRIKESKNLLNGDNQCLTQ